MPDLPAPSTIIIIGAGVGGLSAAIRLAQQGHAVQILEARDQAGGLASGLTAGGFTFDAGPLPAGAVPHPHFMGRK